MDAKKLLEEICVLLKECGEIMLKADRSSAAIDAKGGHKNFVTSYDKSLQDKIRKRLAELLPEARFVGEEGDTDDYSEVGYAFIVDPIDGTTNFIKDYHMSCTSIGLIKDGEQYMGAIYNPYLDEMYTAIKGEGAFLNGNPIHVTDKPLEEALVVFGTAPYYPEKSKQAFDMAYEYLQTCIDVRRSGSAALDLCGVAAGRLEIYYEPSLSPWDHAAGSLIVREAGGKTTTLSGGKLSLEDKCSIIASNGVAKVIYE